MLNNKDSIVYLRALGLTTDEAKLYYELLKHPANHQELARSTGVNRTKIYRLADQLEKRSLVTVITDDRGTMLTATDPHTLEVELATKEEVLQRQRLVYKQVLPALVSLQRTQGKAEDDFSVQSYEGIEGFKQMLWHELKAKGTMYIMGDGSLENLIDSKRWAEKHRAMTGDAGYVTKEILNPGSKKDFHTNQESFLAHYEKRTIDPKLLKITLQTVIYNDTVATYNWRGDKKVGVEIINKAYADTMRQVFTNYWQLTTV